MNKELSANIELFIDKLGLELTQSGDNYSGTTQCHGGDGNMSIWLDYVGNYRFTCWTKRCHESGNKLTDLAALILENRNGQIYSYEDVRDFFADCDLKSFSEFKKKFTDPKLVYAHWKNIKAGRTFRHLISLKGVFLPIFLNDII